MPRNGGASASDADRAPPEFAQSAPGWCESVHNRVMVGADDLKWIVSEIEDRLQRVAGDVEDSVRARLSRDLSRAHLYLKAVRTGYADLIPERLSVDLVARYQTPKSIEMDDEPDIDRSPP